MHVNVHAIDNYFNQAAYSSASPRFLSVRFAMNPTVYEQDAVQDGSRRAVRFGGSRGFLLALLLRSKFNLVHPGRREICFRDCFICIKLLAARERGEFIIQGVQNACCLRLGGDKVRLKPSEKHFASRWEGPGLTARPAGRTRCVEIQGFGRHPRFEVL